MQQTDMAEVAQPAFLQSPYFHIIYISTYISGYQTRCGFCQVIFNNKSRKDAFFCSALSLLNFQIVDPVGLAPWSGVRLGLLTFLLKLILEHRSLSKAQA
jgi:hypothetical protein